jgi:hypothetical protein
VQKAVAVAEEALGTAAEVRRDPRAYVGDVKCSNLTVPVTLDNSRSSEAVTFHVLADPTGDFEFFQETVQVPAGEIRIVTVGIAVEDTSLSVWVIENPVDTEWERYLVDALLTVDCSEDDDPHDAQARIGGVDCASMTVDVTLDNSRSESPNTYDVITTKAVRVTPTDRRSAWWPVSRGSLRWPSQRTPRCWSRSAAMASQTI